MLAVHKTALVAAAALVGPKCAIHGFLNPETESEVDAGQCQGYDQLCDRRAAGYSAENATEDGERWGGDLTSFNGLQQPVC